MCRSQWPRSLRLRSAAARFLRLWVRIPPGSWMSVCSECCVLSGRGLCDELITRPEESYRLWCVVVCDLETSIMSRPWPIGGCRASNKQTNVKMCAAGKIQLQELLLFDTRERSESSAKGSDHLTLVKGGVILRLFGWVGHRANLCAVTNIHACAATGYQTPILRSPSLNTSHSTDRVETV